MARFDHQNRILNAKVVYYGPPLSGKTTNLMTLQELVDPERRTRLFSLNTLEDRTLFFDMMPLEIGKILGYRLRLQIYTIPGQIHYKATRRMILQGADACVFVADSRPEALGANLTALEDLTDNLILNGHDIESFPIVFQFNKRDVADACPLGMLQDKINVLSAPSVGCVATDGEGVVETVRLATEGLVQSLIDRFGGLDDTPDREETSDLIGEVFHKFLARREQVVKRSIPEWVRNYPRAGGMDKAAPAEPGGEDSIEIFGDIHAMPQHSVEPPGDDEVQVLETDQLLEQSLQTQMKIAEEYGDLQTEKECLQEEVARRNQLVRENFERRLDAEERHDDLLATLSEDLAGPLSALAEKVEHAARHDDPSATRETLAEAREESDKLRQLVREILSARKDSAGGISFEEVLRAAQELCGDHLTDRGLEMEIRTEDDLPALAGDLTPLAFTLRSVFLTCAEGSPEGSALRLRAFYKEMDLSDGDNPIGRRFVAIQVRDFSPGRTRDDWQRLFANRKGAEKSALARSRDILRRLGGVMQVKSREGKGNLITLYVPVAEAATTHVADRTA